MHVHILGICGSFMGSIALLARAQGHQVSGSDANVYPPMSEVLANAGIALIDGYRAANLEPTPDLVVIGNAMSRGNPEVEAVLARRLRYVSGPQWLREAVLGSRSVLAVAGTHGKTTTASMLAWILERSGLAPGFLIGGVPGNFALSARLGDPQAPFVVEADEYDSAFFDKRSKFVHYRPDIAVLNNLEFDHADIFDDLAAIERQFHQLVRTVPGNGRLLVGDAEPALERVLARGCWTPVERFGERPESFWRLRLESSDASRFTLHAGERQASVVWELSGVHNLRNALAATAAAAAVGVSLSDAAEALGEFRLPRRRQELRGVVDEIAVIDDFAHHPTAIMLTLEGLRAVGGAGRLVAVIEPRSNTMKLGALRARLAQSVDAADLVYWFQPPGLDWSLDEVAAQGRAPAEVHTELERLIETLAGEARPHDRIVVMSNGSFGGLHERLLETLRARRAGSTTAPDGRGSGLGQ